MNKKREFSNVVFASMLVLSSLTLNVSAKEEPVIRLAGETRVETSQVVSSEVYASADTVVIAGYHGEVDALTASIIAAQNNAPLLMVSNKAEDIDLVRTEIERLGATHAILLGDEGVISKKVVSELDGLVSVSRTGGHDRFDTAVKVAELAGKKHTHVFLTNDGRSGELADALAVGPVSAREESPILLTSSKRLPSQTIEALKKLSVKEITIIGGPTAVSQDIENQLAKDYDVQRIAGENRWETAVQISKKYFAESETVVLTNDGRVSYADAVIAGYLGAEKNAPVLLTQDKRLNEVTANYLGDHSSFAYALGSEMVISKNVVSSVEEAILENYNNAVIIESVNAVEGKITVKFREDVTEVPDGLVIAIDGKELDLDAKVVGGKVEINVPRVKPSREGLTEVEYSVKLGNIVGRTKIFIPAEITPIKMRTIKSIEELDTVEVEFGGDYKLPKNIQVTLSDNESVVVPVEWNPTDIDVEKAGQYELTGQLDLSEVTNLEKKENELEPRITVKVMEKVLDRTDLEKLIDSVEYVEVSTDGLDIKPDQKWTTQQDKSKFNSFFQ